ncbi:MAG: lipid A-modifier LpxR family protein [Motiliproteus sp.]
MKKPKILIGNIVFILTVSFSLIPRMVQAQPSQSINIIFDNDILSLGGSDQDYTAGLSIAYSSQNAESPIFYMTKLVNKIDNIINLNSGSNSVYTIEGGVYGFTPSDMSTSRPDHNDRPYSSILYLSSAHERVDLQAKNAWQSRLTIGVIGLKVFSSLQRNIHNWTGSDPAKGWGNQISDGGELTVR